MCVSVICQSFNACRSSYQVAYCKIFNGPPDVKQRLGGIIFITKNAKIFEISSFEWKKRGREGGKLGGGSIIDFTVVAFFMYLPGLLTMWKSVSVGGWDIL